MVNSSQAVGIETMTHPTIVTTLSTSSGASTLNVRKCRQRRHGEKFPLSGWSTVV